MKIIPSAYDGEPFTAPLRVRDDLSVRSGNRRRAFVTDVGVDHEPAPHDRRSPAATARPVAPKNAAGARVEGEKPAVPGRQEQLPVCDGRGELEQRRVVVECPDAAERRP